MLNQPLPTNKTFTATASGESLCPNGDGGRIVRRDDLVHVEQAGVTAVRVANLVGYVCPRCRSRWYTPDSVQHIRNARGAETSADYEVKVTRIGGRSLGMYLPKDLVRIMELEAGKVGYASRVDRDTIAIRFAEPSDVEETSTDVVLDDLL